jgi:hypothetical protein
MNDELSTGLNRICAALETLRAELDPVRFDDPLDDQLRSTATELITIGHLWADHLIDSSTAAHSCPRAERVLEWMDLMNLAGDLILARVIEVCHVGH